MKRALLRMHSNIEATFVMAHFCTMNYTLHGSGTARAKTISYQVISSGTICPIFFVRVISYHFPGHLVPFLK